MQIVSKDLNLESVEVVLSDLLTREIGNDHYAPLFMPPD